MTAHPTTLHSEVTAPAPLQRTPLFEFHQAHRAHLVPFAGWEMPLYYTGILAEHEAVRSSVGLFDVSHMGILTVTGRQAVALLSRRTTANIAKLLPGQCRYTFLLDATGAIVDDLLITRLDDGGDQATSFLVVPNAGGAAHVLEILRQHRSPDTVVLRHNGTAAILAVQGPSARALLERRFGWELGTLKFYHAGPFPSVPGGTPPAQGRIGFDLRRDLGREILVSRTGYTGEPGYELFVRGEDAGRIAESLVSGGATPCGLGARDTLRLEKGYLLSGQDFLRDRTPLEAAQERFVEFDHPFVGRVALEKQLKEGLSSRLVGIRALEEGAIPRHGTPVLHEGKPVGTVTSGGLSPSLHRGIALAYLPLALSVPGTTVQLALRARAVPAEVVTLPFLSPPSRR